MMRQVPAGYRLGAWEVGAPVAEGAFGSVYEGVRVDGAQGAEPSRVALKLLPTGTRTPRQLHHLQDLAEREIALLSKLHQPRLIRMYEVLTVDDPQRPELDGSPVLVLELARGSLDRLLRADGPIPAALLPQICEGLAQLHGAGWVHGDLKPGNVLLMRDGTVRLCDFNLAAELDGTHAYSPAFSTPDYTPPELQWEQTGERGTRIRTTADIWAFGVLIHLALTGTFPFPGGTPSARREAAARYARGVAELRLSPDLPEGWRSIVQDCLARTHRERAHHTARSLLRRTETAAGTTPARHPRKGRLQLAALASGTALALVAGTAAVTASLVGGGNSSTESREPAGYERCRKGYVCFFTKSQGHGDMCSWYGKDDDWETGTITCPWSKRQAPRSVFNNGSKEKYSGVVYYRTDDYRQPAGCVPRLGRHELPNVPKLRSHGWQEHC